jgi:hypothetical protein
MVFEAPELRNQRRQMEARLDLANAIVVTYRGGEIGIGDREIAEGEVHRSTQEDRRSRGLRSRSGD